MHSRKIVIEFTAINVALPFCGRPQLLECFRYRYAALNICHNMDAKRNINFIIRKLVD